MNRKTAILTLAENLVADRIGAKALQDKQTRRAACLMAGQIADEYLDKGADLKWWTWPDDMPEPTREELYEGLVRTGFPTLLDHAVEWAGFQVALHRCGPFAWQILTAGGQDRVWREGPAGPRDVALGAQAIEVSMRGIVIHLQQQGQDVDQLNLDALFEAIDKHIAESGEEDQQLSANNLARIGLRALDMGRFIR